MAKGKKAFILYNDLITVVEKLITKDRENGTNDAGELFFHILSYVNDKNPKPVNFIIEMAFEPIKLQIQRDIDKYEKKREKNRENANKRWEQERTANKRDMRPHTTASNGTNRNANHADTDTDTDTVKDIDIYSFDRFWNDYDKKVNKEGSLNKWKKLSRADIVAIKNHLPSYVAATPDKQYRKNPATYLNQKSWEDEIISKNGSEEKPTKTYKEYV